MRDHKTTKAGGRLGLSGDRMRKALPFNTKRSHHHTHILEPTLPISAVLATHDLADGSRYSNLKIFTEVKNIIGKTSHRYSNSERFRQVAPISNIFTKTNKSQACCNDMSSLCPHPWLKTVREKRTPKTDRSRNLKTMHDNRKNIRCKPHKANIKHLS